MTLEISTLPNLHAPNLETTITRERFLSKALDKNNSKSAYDTKLAQLRRLDYYSENIHKMSTDNVIGWINSFDDTDKRKKLAVNYLDKYVEFCKIDHPNIITRKGRKLKGEKPTYSAKYYIKIQPTLKKLHNNSFAGYYSTAKSYLSQVGGIRLHDDDLISINLPISRKRGDYDDEQAEPLTDEQARRVLSHLRAVKTIAVCHVMNDTGFRVTEAGLIQEKHINLEKTPCEIFLPPENSKGGRVGGTRYIRDSTVLKVKHLLTGDHENFVFKKNKKQSATSFRHQILEQLRTAYDKEGLVAVYEDTQRHKYNTHSWRKRCGTEYKRNNGEDLAHGYLRHTKYLAQYMHYSQEERVQSFRKAEIDLAIDGIEKASVKLTQKERQIEGLEKEKKEMSREDLLDFIMELSPEELERLAKKKRVSTIS